ncbi:hypothetical protein QJS66_02575 [Kocuria rhizophila]|nr:hypothetical protein QJS66_02575 [Kocuria rhizophila]
MNTMVSMCARRSPSHLVVSFDLEGPAALPGVRRPKGGRDETPEEFRPGSDGSARPGGAGRSDRHRGGLRGGRRPGHAGLPHHRGRL